MYGLRFALQSQAVQSHSQQSIPTTRHLPDQLSHGEEYGNLRQGPAGLAPDGALPPLVEFACLLFYRIRNGGFRLLRVGKATLQHELVALLISQGLAHWVGADVAGGQGARIRASSRDEGTANEKGSERDRGVPWQLCVDQVHHLVGQVEEGVEEDIFARRRCMECAGTG